MSTHDVAAEAGADTTSSNLQQARHTAPGSDDKKTQPALAPTTTAPSASPSQYDTSPPPDGGITAWSQVLAAHLACINTWGYSVGFAVFQLYYRETALPSLPASSISWIGSVQLLLAWTLSIVSGRIADMGYIRHLYFTGGMLVVLGMMLTSICTEYWQFMLCQGVLNGVGAGLLFLPASANVGTYFARNRGLAMATASVGASVGAVVYPAIVQYLTPRVGFGWSVRVCGFVSLALSACGLAVLRQRNLYRTPRPMVDLGAFRSTVFSAFCIAVFLLHFCLFPVMFYINSFAREVIHVSSLESINFVLIANGVAVLPRPIVGIVADRLLGAHNTYICTAVGFGALVYGWAGVRDTAGLYAFSAGLGIANGATQGIFPGATSGLIARETGGDMSRMGTWMGMVFGVCGIASLAGPPAMGAIVAASGGRYIWAQVFYGTLLMASAGVLFVAPRLKRKGDDGAEKEASS